MSDDQSPHVYKIAGKELTCSHCGGNEFYSGTAQLNTPGLTFLGLDWLNRNATIYVCTTCNHIEWFAKDA